MISYTEEDIFKVHLKAPFNKQNDIKSIYVKPKPLFFNISPKYIANDLPQNVIPSGLLDPIFMQMLLCSLTFGDELLASSLGPNKGRL